MSKKITIKNAVSLAISKFKNKNILSVHLDAELLLAYVLKKEKEFLFTYPEKKLTTRQFNKYQTLIKRRLGLEPIAYLIGHKEFYGLDFKINKNVLIPRPETELMVEEIINFTTHNLQPTTFIDIGVGSGCIIIALAKELLNKKLGIENYEFYGIDLLKNALRVAGKNACLHGVDKKIKFLRGNLLEPILKNKKLGIENWELVILANLPYLTEKQYQKNKELHFEPRSALVGGKDGLEYIERLFQQIKKLLVVSHKLSVSIFIEIDPAQIKKIRAIIKKYFTRGELQIKKDLYGRDRLAKIKLLS